MALRSYLEERSKGIRYGGKSVILAYLRSEGFPAAFETDSLWLNGASGESDIDKPGG
jgi:hypothetical protein